MTNLWQFPNIFIDGKHTIFIDMDNTLVNTTQGLKNWYQKYCFNYQIKEKKFNETNYNVSTWVDNTNLKYAFEEQYFFLNLEPNENAIDAITLLSKIHNVIICSVTNSNIYPYAAQEKTQWIQKHLPMLHNGPTNLVLTEDKSILHGHYLIDDNPEIDKIGINAENIHWEHVVFNQPYNEINSNKKFIINNWKQILDECKKY